MQKASWNDLPAEECIRGSDATGRAKSVSSEKQIQYDLSRNKYGKQSIFKKRNKGRQYSVYNL